MYCYLSITGPERDCSKNFSELSRPITVSGPYAEDFLR